MQLTKPKVYFVGSTVIDKEGLAEFLVDTGNEQFLDILTGCDMMDIVSFYAKLCYRSLTLGKNENVTKIRDIQSNFMGVIESCHGSVLEHAYVNFVASGVSRIETTEHIRHRAGTAFSGESGRYCYDRNLQIWHPMVSEQNEVLKKAINEVVSFSEQKMNEVYDTLIPQCKNFHDKKVLTSAIRRMKPLGCAETLGFSINLRSARHTIEIRTSEAAEEEIRIVFGQVAEILKSKIPAMFYDCKEEVVDGHKRYVFDNRKI